MQSLFNPTTTDILEETKLGKEFPAPHWILEAAQTQQTVTVLRFSCSAVNSKCSSRHMIIGTPECVNKAPGLHLLAPHPRVPCLYECTLVGSSLQVKKPAPKQIDVGHVKADLVSPSARWVLLNFHKVSLARVQTVVAMYLTYNRYTVNKLSL